MYGKAIRLARLINSATHKTCIVPMDHGTTLGPVEGIENYIGTITQVVNGGADALVLHKGLLRTVTGFSNLVDGRYILHLSASTSLGPDSTYKVLVSSVEEAVMLGADGVSVQVNLETDGESSMLKDMGKAAKACCEWGMPLLAMIYTHQNPKSADHIAHGARLAEELGADIVKVNYPGSAEGVEKIIRGVQVPIVVAGGTKMDRPEELLFMISEAIAGGARGVAIGRNVFQHSDVGFFTNVISSLVHGRASLQECLYRLKEVEGKEIGFGQKLAKRYAAK